MTTSTLRPSRPSLMELAKRAGLLCLAPSDLVFEANQPGFAYYDFVLSLASVPQQRGGGYDIYLAKLDSRTNLEWFETIHVPQQQLIDHQLPQTELSLVTLGILSWRQELHQSRLLCLVSQLNGAESTAALEALKRACSKFKCTHHVMAIGQRRQSVGSIAAAASHATVQESMKLRILMCQERSEMSELPAQAIREGRYLLTSNGNPLLCFCFPIN